MKLIRHEDLRSRVSVTLSAMDKHVLKSANLDRYDARDKLVEMFMANVATCVILGPDPVGYGHGMFGVSEPHPFPELATPEDLAAIEIARGRRVQRL